LQLFLFCFTGFGLLNVENLALVLQRAFQVASLDLASNEIFVHALKHMRVGALRHLLVVDLQISLLKALLELA